MRVPSETPSSPSSAQTFLSLFLGSFQNFVYLCIRKCVTRQKILLMIGTRSITDMYMVILASLSNSDKLDLIAKLSNSMRNDAEEKRMRPNLRTCFKGDWSTINAEDLRNHDYHGVNRI